MESMSGNVPGSIPPDDAREAWIRTVAESIRAALDNPAVRREITNLLTGDDERRQRRLEQLACELDGKELTLKLRSDDADSTAEHSP
jgi:hypothetical protein